MRHQRQNTNRTMRAVCRVKGWFRYGAYGVGVACAVSAAYSLHRNEYRADSVGAVRVGRAAVSVLRIACLYRAQMGEASTQGWGPQSQEYRTSRAVCHTAAAHILLQLCQANRGVYIKVGQHLASLQYMIPVEYTDCLQVLHSGAPASSLADVRRVICEELRCADPLDLFEWIDPEPLGTASLAQVHRARLRPDGRPVAVKVQHRHVRGNATVDLVCMEALVWLMSHVFSEFRFQWVVDETRRNIPQELDFEVEGRNAERAAHVYCGPQLPWLRIPAVYWPLSSGRVLTMDLVEGGGQVNDLRYIERHRIDARQLSDRLGQLYAHMIFVHGFMHADPHPGNIHVLPDQSVVLLDHGLYATLTDRFRVEYAHLWISILAKDRRGMRLHSERLGIPATEGGGLYGLFACMVAGRTWEGIMGGGGGGGEREALRNELPNLLPQITNVLDTVDRQMLLVLKANDLLRGIEWALHTQSRHGALNAMARTCLTCVYDSRLGEASGHVNRTLVRAHRTLAFLRLRLLHILLALRLKLAPYLPFIHN